MGIKSNVFITVPIQASTGHDGCYENWMLPLFRITLDELKKLEYLDTDHDGTVSDDEAKVMLFWVLFPGFSNKIPDVEVSSHSQF